MHCRTATSVDLSNTHRKSTGTLSTQGFPPLRQSIPSLNPAKFFKRLSRRSFSPPQAAAATSESEPGSAPDETDNASSAAGTAPTSTTMTTNADPGFAAIAHWANYGQFNDRPDDPKQPRAISTSWGDLKQFVEPISIAWDVPVRKADVRRLALGFIPQQMEDKWFIYSEDTQLEDEEGQPVQGLRVHLYRSWTSYKMVELEVAFSSQLDEQGFPQSVRVRKLTYETSTKSVKGADEAWAKETTREVFAWILRVRLGQEGAQDVEAGE